jgi:hypothetical protein
MPTLILIAMLLAACALYVRFCAGRCFKCRKVIVGGAIDCSPANRSQPVMKCHRGCRGKANRL